jgi:hypothetical protein
MAKGRESFEKRRLQKVRQERKAEKRDRREQRKEDDGSPAPDETTLMERFRVISEQRSAGALTEEQYEDARREIFVALGLESDNDSDSENENENENA